MAFKVGDLVQIIDEDEEGVILEIHNHNKVVVELHGFPFEYMLSQLIRVGEDHSVIHKTHEKNFDHILNDPNHSSLNEVQQHIPIKPFDKLSKNGYPEIDLHIYELVDKPKDLSNAEMVQIQIFRLEQFVQNCMEQFVNEFVIIHGVGEGVLKLEVRKVLDSHGNMEYDDANYREYGSGATQVKIRGLFKG